MRHPSSKRVILMRKSLALIMLICVLVVYVIWTSDDFIQRVEPQPAAIINDSAYVCSESLDDTRHWLASFNAGNTPTTTSADQTSTSTTTAATTTTNPTSTRVPTTEPPATIYFVTPTYPRREQIAELTRLGQTLMHVPHLHWIVADDFDGCNALLDTVLRRLGIPFTHLSSPMDEVYRSLSPIPRGVANRRAAIRWIRANGRQPGVLYFGDDDNTFDLRLFEEIRSTRKVTMFPVGLIGLYAVSAPVVKEGQVIGFYDSWPAKRRWPVDMAGFAVSLEYLARSPNATMPYRAGYEEDEFLQSIGLQLADIEPRANNCTEVLVWHTQTKKEKPALVRVEESLLASDRSSLGALLRELRALGVSHVSASASAGGIVPQLSRDGKSRPIAKMPL